MREVISVLESGERSFVVYGEPQSGKTEFMIALTCKLIDLGYETIFVVMNDNTELETQNFRRFHRAAELNPTPFATLRFWIWATNVSGRQSKGSFSVEKTRHDLER